MTSEEIKRLFGVEQVSDGKIVILSMTQFILNVETKSCKNYKDIKSDVSIKLRHPLA